MPSSTSVSIFFIHFFSSLLLVLMSIWSYCNNHFNVILFPSYQTLCLRFLHILVSLLPILICWTTSPLFTYCISPIKVNSPPMAVVRNHPSQISRNGPELKINTQTASLNPHARACRLGNNKAEFTNEISMRNCLLGSIIYCNLYKSLSPLYSTRKPVLTCVFRPSNSLYPYS